jgi:hypothetical protein
MTRERVTIDLPLSETVDIERVRGELGLAEWVDLGDAPVRRAVAVMWACRRAPDLAQALGLDRELRRGAIPAKTFGGSGFRLTCPSSNATGPFRRTLNDTDYLVPRDDGKRFVALLKQVHRVLGSRYFHFTVADDDRFNALRGGKRFRVRAIGETADGEVHPQLTDIFTGELSFCHRIDVEDALRAPALTVPLALLILSKCQFVKRVSGDRITEAQSHRVIAEIGNEVAIGMEDKDLVDVAAAFADHAVDAPDLAVEALLARTSRDWGLARTVRLNLRNERAVERVLAGRGATPATVQLVASRMVELADRVEDAAPRPPRFRVRRIWWEEVEED